MRRVAGIELGLRLAEPSVRPVCFVESEPFAQRILWEDGVPVWDDLKTFDPTTLDQGWSSLLQGSPVNPSPRMASGGRPIIDGSGNGSQRSFASFDPDSCSWKTSPGANPVQQVACERRPTVLGDPGMKRWSQ